MDRPRVGVHIGGMSRNAVVQRDVKAEAKKAGMSAADFVMREIEAAAPGSLTIRDILDLTSALPPLTLSQEPADVIRELRGPLPDA